MLGHIGNENCLKLHLVLEKVLTTVWRLAWPFKPTLYFLQRVLLRALMRQLGRGSFLSLRATEHPRFLRVPSHALG